jgi:hypothetical protein
MLHERTRHLMTRKGELESFTDGRRTRRDESGGSPA